MKIPKINNDKEVENKENKKRRILYRLELYIKVIEHSEKKKGGWIEK